MRRTRRQFLRSASIVCATGFATAVAGQEAWEWEGEWIQVPETEPTIQDGVDAANAGDVVLIEPGTYAEEVEVTTPEITIRGADRNAVVLDGEFDHSYGIEIEADGVAIENLTARHYTGTAFYWTEIEGFRGSYLTAYNNGSYGIYAYRSSDGRFERSYASGHPDAGFYLGRNHPFHAVITDVVAERNAMGYSGTSAGGDLTIRDSVWRNNAAGIVPNTLDEIDPPQRSTRIVGNLVADNDNEDAPNKDFTYPALGSGILLWGGSDNLVAFNAVRDHDEFGIVAEPNVAEPSDNVVYGNRVRESGTADLALGDPAGEGNRFQANAFETSLPSAIEDDASDGDPAVSAVFEERERRAEDGEFEAGDWRDQPEPDDRPTMSDPGLPPRPASKDGSWLERLPEEIVPDDEDRRRSAPGTKRTRRLERGR